MSAIANYPIATRERRCACGKTATWMAWRWNAADTRTEEPFCQNCKSAADYAERRAGYSSEVTGWRWEWIEP